ncbi:hypothetical protein CHS0354_008343 [Potamilus streckersoni]|nr:hypothetical protein CHS0354_008343 [Potamilus streckersoni]
MVQICLFPVWMFIYIHFTSLCVANIEWGPVPESNVVVYGQDLFLHCPAVLISSKVASYLFIWQFNDGPRPAKSSIFSNHTLYIPDIKKDDLGNYTCSMHDENSGELLHSSSTSVFHAFIHMFLVSPASVYVNEDDIISFNCITGESAPPAELFWEWNGQPFQGGEQYNTTYGGSGDNSLIRQHTMKLVLKAKPYFDGTFNCVARNALLNINVRSLTALLSTVEREGPPYLLEELVMTQILANSAVSLVLNCPVDGKPKVTVFWFYNGQDTQLVNTTDFFILKNNSLYFPTPSWQIDGLYNCKGVNEHGAVVSPNISVTIARLDLDFKRPPSNTFAIAGQPVLIYCNPPISVPSADIAWYKDSQPLVTRSGEQEVKVIVSSEGSWDLYFSQVQKIDEGDYFCVANNKFAVPSTRTSRVVTLSVGGAPIFINPPASQTLVKGSLANLSCIVQGDPFPMVTWMFEGQAVVEGSSVYLRNKNQELYISNVNKANEGTYTCKAENRYGQIKNQVYMKILISPVVLQPVGQQVVSVEKFVIIPCVVYSDPPATVKWYRDGTEVILSKRIVQLNDSLRIETTMAADNGTYVCKAQNIVGSVQSSGTLIVQVRPAFQVSPVSQMVTLGNNLTLTCIATGYPTPFLAWLYNGSSQFPPNVYLSLDHQQLSISLIDWRHVGVYSCLAQNVEGSATTFATLSLQVPPIVERIDGVPVLYQGENLTLICLGNGIPDPLAEWRLNGGLVSSTGNGRISFPGKFSVSIKFVTREDAGNYTCLLRNPAGVGKKSIQVYVIEPPSPPVLFASTSISSSSVTLSWSLEQRVSQTPITKVLIYYKRKMDINFTLYHDEVSSSVTNFDVHGLDPATEYLFKVAAVNGAGESGASNIISATTMDGGPSSPRNLQVIQVTATTVELSWEIPATSNGEIKRFQISYKPSAAKQDYLSNTVPGVLSAQVSYIVTDLHPYTYYDFIVRAANLQGDIVLWGNYTDPVFARTGLAAPADSPKAVFARVISSTTVEVRWEAVPPENQNGPIKRYHVRYFLPSNLSAPVGEKISDSLDLKINISNLDPWTDFSFVVVAENDAGQSPSSQMVYARTMPAVPTGAPANVVVKALTSTAIQVSWAIPPKSTWNSELTGSVLEYRKSLTNITQRIWIPSLAEREYIIGFLDPYTEYMFKIAVYTSQVHPGVGPFSIEVSTRTAQSEPGPIGKYSYTSNVTSVTLIWEPPAKPNGIVAFYLIQYFASGLVTQADTLNITTGTEFNQTQQFNETVSSIQRKKRQLLDSHTGDLDLSGLTTVLQSTIIAINHNLTSTEFNVLVLMCSNFSHGDLNILKFKSILESAIENYKPGVIPYSELDAGEVTLLSSLNITWTVFNFLVKLGASLDNTCAAVSFIQEGLHPPNEFTSGPIMNTTTNDTVVTLVNLSPGTVYNTSITAFTTVGPGESVHFVVNTARAVVTPAPTTLPATSVETPLILTTTKVTPVQEEEVYTPTSIPIIVGGSFAALFVIILIILAIVCIWCVRLRQERYSEDRAVIPKSADDGGMYSESEEDRTPGQLSYTSDESLESGSRSSSGNVDILATSKVQYISPKKSRVPNSSASEYNLGIENPAFGATALPMVRKQDHLCGSGQSSVDRESITKVITLSAEDLYSLDDNTLKRNHRMKRESAAAIARARNTYVTSGISFISDTSSLISQDHEVVYNERTAL